MEEKSVIVYRSKQEKAFDEFMWNNGASVLMIGPGYLCHLHPKEVVNKTP